MKLGVFMFTWALAAIGLVALPENPMDQPNRPNPTTTTTTVAAFTGTTKEMVVPGLVRNVDNCDDVVRLAIKVGWPADTLAHLARIAWRESNCQEYAYNPRDPKGGSYGVLQINGAHLEKTPWRPQGFLQSQGIGVNSAEDLFIAELNLRAGLALYHFASEHYGDGWQPWNATRDKD